MPLAIGKRLARDQNVLIALDRRYAGLLIQVLQVNITSEVLRQKT